MMWTIGRKPSRFVTHMQRIATTQELENIASTVFNRSPLPPEEMS
jgi:hypothetical protein